MEKYGIRKRKVATQFRNLSSSISSSSESDEFGDNSIDDPNYDPVKNKRQRIGDAPLSDDSFNLDAENFDKEFDEIESLHINTENSVNTVPEQSTSIEGDVAISNDSSKLPLDAKYFQRVLLNLHENSLQILERISVIEESLIKSGNLITTKMFQSEKTAFAKYHAFSNANRLPMQTLEEVKTFENHLSQSKFQEEAVRSRIPLNQLKQQFRKKTFRNKILRQHNFLYRSIHLSIFPSRHQ